MSVEAGTETAVNGVVNGVALGTRKKRFSETEERRTELVAGCCRLVKRAPCCRVCRTLCFRQSRGMGSVRQVKATRGGSEWGEI